MKKLLSLLLISAITATTLFGCASTKAPVTEQGNGDNAVLEDGALSGEITFWHSFT